MRKAKMYAMDVRQEDRIARRWAQCPRFGRVFRVRNMGPGYCEFKVTFGGEEETWTMPDTSMVWIEIP